MTVVSESTSTVCVYSERETVEQLPYNYCYTALIHNQFLLTYSLW